MEEELISPEGRRTLKKGSVKEGVMDLQYGLDGIHPKRFLSEVLADMIIVNALWHHGSKSLYGIMKNIALGNLVVY